VAHLVELVQRWGVSGSELLAGAGLDAEALKDPGVRVPVVTMVTLFERARTLTRQPALGVYLGLDIRPTLYGNLGFALMSASTVGEAIDLAIRFCPIITTAIRLRLRVEDRVASLILDEEADFGPARDIVVISALVSLRQGAMLLAVRDAMTSVAEFALPEPPYASELARANIPMRFGCPAHRLVFDARSLAIPYTTANSMALRVAREHCQRELDRLGPAPRWSDAVRGLLSRPEESCPSLEEAASALHVSTRTLKRHLAAEGASFTTLRESELRDRAIALVRSSTLSYAQIAERLGYSHVTSFERAFRRWTSRSPAEIRRAARGAAPGPVASARGKP
jgi:AraC-like DNA-binding protein